MIQKNEFYKAEIEGITLEGSGIARIDGFTVFIPLTAPGDYVRFKVIKVLKHYGFGLLDQLIRPSPDRISDTEPICPAFRQCGGCAFCHITYEAEQKLKEDAVRDAFQRLAKFHMNPLPILGAKKICRYRNKAQYPLGMNREGKVIAGFYARSSHRIVSAADCPLQPVLFSNILQYVVNYLNQHHLSAYDELSGKGFYRHVYLRQAEASGEIMLCLVSTSKNPPRIHELASAVQKAFPEIVSIWLNVNSQKTNVILGKEYILLAGKEQITDEFLGKKLAISPASFYQVNREQAQRLYSLAFNFAEFTGNEHLLDLYCGIGSIGLSAADRISSLTGVEIIPQAVENARQNALLNGINQAEFFCSDAAGAAKKLAADGAKPDIILVDPPRKGCGQEVLDAIFQMAPQKVVMISCNPSTAARDCRILADGGYQLIKYQPVDLFPRTAHCECVALLTRSF